MVDYPTPGTPRTKDGKPNLAAPAPRAADGKPDLSGVWHPQPTPLAEWKRILGDDRVDATYKVNVPGQGLEVASKYVFNILLDFKPEETPMRAETAGILRRWAQQPHESRTCLPAGMPGDVLLPEPHKIVQSSGLVVVLLEAAGHRQIYTDGRALPKEVAQASWFGYSVGKWEGETFVVETSGFNDKTRLRAHLGQR
jgi:hypothetical protein